jgi:hypothetical protein
LDSICKIYERNKKTEKEKKKRKEKYEMDPGKMFQPNKEIGPQPANSTHLPGPRHRLPPLAEIDAGDRFLPVVTPLLNTLKSLPVSISRSAYK